MSHKFQQIIVHPFKDAQLIIHRNGNHFRVFRDIMGEGPFEYSPEWVQFHSIKLFLISDAASRILDEAGLDVRVYG